MSVPAIILLVLAIAMAAFMDFRALRAIYRLTSAFYRRTLNPAEKGTRQ
ncbi:MAG: hypothetical protein KDJ55_12600 [Rhodobiaceae bacterium]|nr:hypothetical protein [Rhodobiaceae bacterium]MCC0012224.1 hypothetical protein [Rhodobiaceae bacterium]MCC0019067.1 hypothetical protein [Rhodobiaceae bacterium]MCC0050920.1 hypothetical protein [Rhodobiaceae bacterium]MCC0060861.1 hypothetical protein [Rhodobiaceae bacterium]